MDLGLQDTAGNRHLLIYIGLIFFTNLFCDSQINNFISDSYLLTQQFYLKIVSFILQK